MSEKFENKVEWIPDEETLYRLQLQIQARQIDKQRRKDEVAAQYKIYEGQIKNLFVTLNTLSKRIWILVNNKSYNEYYDILRYQNDYTKIEDGQVFQKITNYLLTPKMDINAMLSLCNNNDKFLQLPRFIYLLSLFCYLYSNEMASLFVDFFLQINSDKIEAFSQCFLVNPNIQIYFITALKPIFKQLTKSQKKESLFQELLDSLSMFSPLIPKFFIRLLKKSEFRSLIFYRLLKTFLSRYDAFGIASPEIILYYRSQIKGVLKMARKYFTGSDLNDFILNSLLLKNNIEKNCSFVPHESAIKKIFPYLYRPFILVDKMSLSNLNLTSDYLYVYLAQSQEEISKERSKGNLNQNQDVFDEMVEINKITKKSNFDSNSIFISKSNSDFNLGQTTGSQQKLSINSSSDSFFYSGQSSEQIKIVRRDDDFDSQENQKIAKKLFLRIAQRFLSKANLVKIIETQDQTHNYSNKKEMGKRTIFLFKRIAELSSVSKNPDLEIEIDKLEIILNQYPMSINDLATLFEENDYSTVIRNSNNQKFESKFVISGEGISDDDDSDDEDDGLSNSALSSLSSNPLFALSLYGKQYMMLKKILALLDDVNKSAYESAIFRMILDNSNSIDKSKTTNSFIEKPLLFFQFYREELKRLQNESSISKIFDQKTISKSSSSSLLMLPELPYKSLFLICMSEAGVNNRKEYPESIKKYNKQMKKILNNDEGRNSYLRSLGADKSTKIFFENPSKLQPFIDQLKIVFLSKNDKVEIKKSNYKINPNLNEEDGTTSSEELIGVSANSNEKIKKSSHSMIVLSLMISNMNRAVMILTELLNANGAKESGMDQYLPLTMLGIIYASPPKIYSVIYFLKNFVIPLLDDDNQSIFSNQEKFNIMLLHSALSIFEQKHLQ